MCGEHQRGMGLSRHQHRVRKPGPEPETPQDTAGILSTSTRLYPLPPAQCSTAGAPRAAFLPRMPKRLDTSQLCPRVSQCRLTGIHVKLRQSRLVSQSNPRHCHDHLSCLPRGRTHCTDSPSIAKVFSKPSHSTTGSRTLHFAAVQGTS